MTRSLKWRRGVSKRVAQSTASAIAATCTIATPVEATPFPGNSTLTLADNSFHTICRSDLTDRVSVAVEWARNRIDATDMSSSILACTGDTDSINFDQNYTTFNGLAWHGSGGSVIGLNLCIDQHKGICRQSEDRYDISWTVDAPLNSRRTLAMHEIGHSIGFGHEPSDKPEEVMNQEINPLTDYSAHEKGHINATW